MIATSILILTVGLMLGLGTLGTQMIAVLGFESNSRWTDPLPTIAGMGIAATIGLGTLLIGLVQLTVQ